MEENVSESSYPQEFEIILNLSNIVVRSSSVVALLTAIAIFLSSRTLYTRDNVKIHINLFISNILMDVTFIYLEIENQFYLSAELADNETMADLFNETFSCKTHHCAINAVNLYFEMSNYSWMSCEASFLCYMIYKVWFENKMVLKVIYYVGWGIPALLTFAFSTQVFPHCETNYNDWLCRNITDSEAMTIFFKVPADISLVLNACALASIVVYLTIGTRQLQPSCRRGFRSLLILMPLLGVYHFFPGYMPKSQTMAVLNSVISSSQGFLVATIFCFTNMDVRTEINRTWRRSFASSQHRQSSATFFRTRPSMTTAIAD